MRIDRPPYWLWQFDRWNLLVAVVLLGAVVITAATGGGAPAALTPTITQPAAGAALNYAAPGAIAGRTAPGARVRVYDGDTLVGETTAEPAGSYRFSLPTLGPGPHTLTTRVYDAKGNLLATSEPITINIVGGPVAQATPTPAAPQPTVAAPAPTATAPAPTPTPRPTVAPPTVTGLSEGGQLPAGKPGELSGTAAPGTKIQIYDGDKLIGETTAGPDGKWSLTLPPLSAGAHILKARAVAPDGNVLAESAPIKVTAVTVAPPAFTGLTEGGQLPAGKPGELSGTAAPGTKIQIYDGDKLIGETTAGPDGKWSLTLPPLTEGAHTLKARAVAPDGNVLAESAPIKVTAAAATATATAQPTATATTQPTATATRAPTATATPSPAPTQTATALPTATLVPGAEVVTLTEGAPISLSGSAAPGTKLRIYDGETLIGETIADADGQWRLTLPPLTVGQHMLTARVYDAAGKLVSSSTPLYVIVVPKSAPGAGTPSVTPVTPGKTPVATVTRPEITNLKPGAQLPATAPGLLEGTAEPGSTVRIYDGDKLIAEVVVGPDGKWRILLPALSAGVHALSVRVVAPDGTEQLGAVAVPVTVVPGPTATPVTPSAGVAAVVTPMISRPAGALGSSQPALSGTAAPRSVVRIYEGDYLIGETQADARGRWVFVPPIALAVGKHTLRVTSVGPDGKEVPGGTIEVIVAEGATGLKPLTFAPSTGKAPSAVGVLQGSAPPDTIVSIYEGAAVLAKVLADAKGQWQYALPAKTRAGQHTYRIEVATRDDVTLYRSEPTSVTIN
ncbi:MAG: large repetitive protein [Chloroflexota bacterium]|nr:large repetitive protein [Chloroflexota bacterium]